MCACGCVCVCVAVRVRGCACVGVRACVCQSVWKRGRGVGGTAEVSSAQQHRRAAGGRPLATTHRERARYRRRPQARQDKVQGGCEEASSPHAHKHARTHTHTRTRAHARTHTRTHASTRCRFGSSLAERPSRPPTARRAPRQAASNGERWPARRGVGGSGAEQLRGERWPARRGDGSPAAELADE